MIRATTTEIDEQEPNVQFDPTANRALLKFAQWVREISGNQVSTDDVMDHLAMSIEDQAFPTGPGANPTP